MRKSTRSILQELSDIGLSRDTDLVIENRGANLIQIHNGTVTQQLKAQQVVQLDVLKLGDVKARGWKWFY